MGNDDTKGTPKRLRFVGQLADVMHPVKVGRDGVRITIDVPVTEMPKALPLLAMTDCALEVQITER